MSNKQDSKKGSASHSNSRDDTNSDADQQLVLASKRSIPDPTPLPAQLGGDRIHLLLPRLSNMLERHLSVPGTARASKPGKPCLSLKTFYDLKSLAELPQQQPGQPVQTSASQHRRTRRLTLSDLPRLDTSNVLPGRPDPAADLYFMPSQSALASSPSLSQDGEGSIIIGIEPLELQEVQEQRLATQRAALEADKAAHQEKVDLLATQRAAFETEKAAYEKERGELQDSTIAHLFAKHNHTADLQHLAEDQQRMLEDWQELFSAQGEWAPRDRELREREGRIQLNEGAMLRHVEELEASSNERISVAEHHLDQRMVGVRASLSKVAQSQVKATNREREAAKKMAEADESVAEADHRVVGAEHKLAEAEQELAAVQDQSTSYSARLHDAYALIRRASELHPGTMEVVWGDVVREIEEGVADGTADPDEVASAKEVIAADLDEWKWLRGGSGPGQEDSVDEEDSSIVGGAEAEI